MVGRKDLTGEIYRQLRRRRTKSFARKVDAERFLLGVEDAKLGGA